MNPRVLVLGLAAVSGLGAMMAANWYLKLNSTGAPPPEPNVEVVIAAKSLMNSDTFKKSSDLVKVVSLKQSLVPPDAYTKDRLGELEGRWVNVPMVEGEPIVERKLGAKGSMAGIKAKIPEGMRAFTIRVNPETIVGGYVKPDDQVDIIYYNQQQAVSRTVLENVTVIALGGSLQATAEQQVMEAPTATLAVTQEEANLLFKAIQSGGHLSFTLRSLRMPAPKGVSRIVSNLNELGIDPQIAKDRDALREQTATVSDLRQQQAALLSEMETLRSALQAATAGGKRRLTVHVGMNTQRYQEGDKQRQLPGAAEATAADKTLDPAVSQTLGGGNPQDAGSSEPEPPLAPSTGGDRRNGPGASRTPPGSDSDPIRVGRASNSPSEG